MLRQTSNQIEPPFEAACSPENISRNSDRERVRVSSSGSRPRLLEARRQARKWSQENVWEPSPFKTAAILTNPMCRFFR